jgi:hypothetical protein
LPANFGEGNGVALTVHGNSHDIGAFIRQGIDLVHRGIDILGMSCRHTLHRNRVTISDYRIADANFASRITLDLNHD